MQGTPFRIDVRPHVPERIGRLEQFASNLWYSWHRPTRTLFARLNPTLWSDVAHSPKAMLATVEQERLDRAAADPSFLEAYDRAAAAYDAYHSATGRPAQFSGDDLVAYFCAEFGLHESVPIYSGGLGILAGDHCKSASDLHLPFVGIGLLYRQGYFQQLINGDGRQHATYSDTDFELLPIELMRREARELRVEVDLPGRRAHLRVWQAAVGHVSLYLLDTDVAENTPQDREITRQLYVGNPALRLEQEMLLGAGGARALAALGIAPTAWHLNEGHPAFLSLERVRALCAQGLGFDAALEAVAASTVFTTHTPVPAGHDHFAQDAVRAHLDAAFPELRPHLDAALALGRTPGSAEFNMTMLAARTSRAQNGVSRIHGGVSERICAPLWGQVDAEENPVSYVTNGVHLPTFLSDAWHELLGAGGAAQFWERLADADCWRAVRAIRDEDFWKVHQSLKSQMLHLVRNRIRRQRERNKGSEAHLDRIFRLADPDRPEALTIGFARRFATYKRATLIFQRLDWLREIVCDAERPVVFVFAGKAHPQDQPGQDLIRRVTEVAEMPEFESRILFVENYDLRLARRLVSGVDVWLNNPVYPMEACGTSGMKAAINGVLNLSVLDGWWAEGYQRGNGWAIKPAAQSIDPARRDAEEARELYELLQDQIVPLYYARNAQGYSPGWVAMAKEAMASITPQFSSDRMVREYTERFYVPAIRAWQRMAPNGFEGAHALAAWKAKLRSAWNGVKLRRLDDPIARLDFGRSTRVAVRVHLNGLDPSDVVVEAVLARPEARHAGESLERLRLSPGELRDGECLYSAELAPRFCGRIDCRLRVYPVHELLVHPYETGMMLWL